MNAKEEREEQLTLELLDTIGKNSKVSQRHLAREMGVALGLANSYLKRCIRKGFVKIKEVPANRYLYYVTPKGLAEKSRLTARYLAYSFSFYRHASESCRKVFEQCLAKGWDRVMLCGVSDLAEIASLRALELDIKIVAVYDPSSIQKHLLNIRVCSELGEVAADAYVLTDFSTPQKCYQQVVALVDEGRILVPDLLRLE